MPSLSVVPDFDPPEDCASRLCPSREAGSVNTLFFERGKETLGRCVVPAVSLAAHATNDPRFSELVL